MRVPTPFVRLMAATVVMAGLGSCSRGPAPLILEDNGRFIDARLSADGHTGVITFQRSVRVPREYWSGGFLFFGGSSKPRPVGIVADRNYAGVYERYGSTFRVLVARDNTEWLPRNGAWHVGSVEGTMALIYESGQLRDYQTGPSKYYVLNTGTGELIHVPLREEVASSDVALAHVHTVTATGVIILATKLPFEDPAYDTMLPLWARYPTGEYVQVSDAGVYRSVTRHTQDILYMTPTGGRLFSPQTRESLEMPSSVFRTGPPHYPMYSLHTDGRSVRLNTATSRQSHTISAVPIDTDLTR